MAAKSKKEKLSVSLYKNPVDHVKDNIKIDRELECLIPPLSPEESEQLEASLLQEGCREPIVVWRSEDDYILIDGHNRYRLCQKHGISFQIHLKDFTDRAEAKDWMIANQMARRNLSPLQLSYLRGLRYQNEKNSRGGLRERNYSKGQNVLMPSPTSEKLSEEFGVNEKTIRRDAKFVLGLEKFTQGDESLRWSILNGQIQAKKNTISELADKDLDFLNQVQLKVVETESLEKAIKLLTSDAGEKVKNQATVDSEDLPLIKKKISSLTTKALKMDKTDPNRKEVINELRHAFKEFIKGLEV